MTRSILSTLLAGSALMLSGCATYSFAPPNVPMTKVSAEGEAHNGKCGITASATNIRPDLAGAAHLIDNYLLTYTCARRQVANGRQDFEVPGLLVALGGATAAAFGAPAGVAIGTGAAGAGLASAKGYYAPKDKLPVLVAAVDALTCINNESVGLTAYGSSLIDKTPAPVAPSMALDDGAAAEGASIAVSTKRQYFGLVRGVLMSVDNIVAQRLSSVGGYAPDALITEIKALKPPAEPGKDDKDKAANQAGTIVDAVKPAQGATDVEPVTLPSDATPVLADKEAKARLLTDSLFSAKVTDQMKQTLAVNPDLAIKVANNAPQLAPVSATQQDRAIAKAAVTDSLLYLNQLQPKLDACLIRAKL
jgi:hypothetical protein